MPRISVAIRQKREKREKRERACDMRSRQSAKAVAIGRCHVPPALPFHIGNCWLSAAVDVIFFFFLFLLLFLLLCHDKGALDASIAAAVSSTCNSRAHTTLFLSFSLSLFLSKSVNGAVSDPSHCCRSPSLGGHGKKKKKKERKKERKMYVVAAAAEMLERANDPCCCWCGVLQQFHPRLRSIVSFLFFSFLSPRPRLSLSLFLSFSLSLIPIPFLDRRMTSIHNSNSSAAHSQGQNLVTELCCCCYCCWLMCVAETLWVDSSSRALISTDAEPTKRLMMPSTKLNSQTESKAKASLPPPQSTTSNSSLPSLLCGAVAAQSFGW